MYAALLAVLAVFPQHNIGKCIGSFLHLITEAEQELIRAVRKAGGMVNTSGLFMSTTSQATVVSSKVGVNRRSVIQIPRSKVPPDALNILDKCKCTNILLEVLIFI